MAYTTPTEAQNAAALDYFVQLPVSKEMIRYLASTASQVIRCTPTQQLNKDLPPTPPTTPPQGVAAPLTAAESSLPSVEAFITAIVKRSHVRVPTLMTSLVYIARLKTRLPPAAKGMPCTVHRIFLAALILAAKNLNDSSPKNSHWARYTTVKGYDSFGFSCTEVNSMERQLLGMLNFDLRVETDDLYTHLETFLAPIRDWQTREAEKARVERAREQRQREQLLAHEYESRVRLEAANIYSSSPYSYSTTSVSSYAQSTRRGYHSRAPSRTPSLSPPTRCSTSSGSVTSSPPGSIMGEPYPSYTDEEIALHQSYDPEAGAHVVHIQAPVSAGNKLPLADPYAKAPAAKRKRSNTGGSIFSRFLGTSRVAGY